MLKVLFSLIARNRQNGSDLGDADQDGNRERPLPQRWRDPPPRPARTLRFSLR